MATPLDLLEGLKERIEEILDGYPALFVGSTQKKFNIYRHKVPERLDEWVQLAGEEETPQQVFPFCVVQVDTGTKERNIANHDIHVNIFIGIENEGYKGEGYDDVLRCITRIWNELNAMPVVAKFFRMKDELDWTLNTNDAETHPEYYGVLRLTFETQSIQYVGGYEHG